MKKGFLIMISVMAFASLVQAQKVTSSVYFELGGPGLASFNFDSRFAKREDGLGGRIGMGGFAIDGSSIVYIPVALNYLFGKDKRNYFEIGAGVTPVFASEDIYDEEGIFTSTFGHLNFGYRLQPATAGFTFRAFMTPVFGSFGFFPFYGGVSFGYKF